MMTDNNFFIHAYNFVQYEKNKSPERINPSDENGELTGYIDCNLSVKTPLSIPDSEQRIENFMGQQGHIAYPFFSVSGKPVIPGSEIRGMIRSIYETVTNSCFSVINSNTISSRNIAGKNEKIETGILSYSKEENRWILHNATRTAAYTQTTKTRLLNDCKGKDYVKRDWDLSVQLSTNTEKLKKKVDEVLSEAKTYDEFKNILSRRPYDIAIEKNEENDLIFVFNSKRNKKTAAVNSKTKWGEQYSENNLKKYFSMEKSQRNDYLKKYYSEPIINFSVFVPEKIKNINAEKLAKAVEKFNTVLDFSEIYAEGKKETLSHISEIRPSKEKRVPVFYRIETNGELIIKPSHFSRELYDNTVESILSDWKKCTDNTKLCPGCRLFGMIGDANNAYASRVRFTDAEVENGYVLDKNFTTLKVLASPKTTGWEFYADREYDAPGVTLRGRKMYFHNPLAASDASVYTHSSREKFNASVKLMKKGEFTFRVYFDNISKEELRWLVLSLTLGENKADGRLMHKLGHGKPLGLGSVKITVSSIMSRNPENYSVEPLTEYLDEIAACNPLKTAQNTVPAGKNTLNDLLNICNFDFCEGFNVSYPLIEPSANARNLQGNDIASHRYFAWMRNALNMGKDAQRQYEYNKLPAVADKADLMKLPILVVDSEKSITRKKDADSGKSNYSSGQNNSYNSNRNNGNYTLECSKCGKIVNLTQEKYERFKNNKNYLCWNCLNESRGY